MTKPLANSNGSAILRANFRLTSSKVAGFCKPGKTMLSTLPISLISKLSSGSIALSTCSLKRSLVGRPKLIIFDAYLSSS